MAGECTRYVCENDIRRPGERRFRQPLDPETGLPCGKIEAIDVPISKCELNCTNEGCIDLRTHGFKKKSIFSYQIWSQRQGV